MRTTNATSGICAFCRAVSIRLKVRSRQNGPIKIIARHNALESFRMFTPFYYYNTSVKCWPARLGKASQAVPAHGKRSPRSSRTPRLRLAQMPPQQRRRSLQRRLRIGMGVLRRCNGCQRHRFTCRCRRLLERRSWEVLQYLCLWWERNTSRVWDLSREDT